MPRTAKEKTQVWILAENGNSFGEILRALREHRLVCLRNAEDLSGLLKALSGRGYGSCAVCAVDRPDGGGRRVVRGSAEELSAYTFPGRVSAFLKMRGTGQIRTSEKQSGSTVHHRTSEKRSGSTAQLRTSEKWKSSSGCAVETEAVVRAHMSLLPGERAYLLGNGAKAFAEVLSGDAGAGDVYAILKDDQAAEMLKREAGESGRTNLHVIRGVLPEALGHLPGADAVLIAGADAPHRDLMQIVKSRNPDVRVVIVTDDPKSAARDLESMKECGFEFRACSIESAGVKKESGRRFSFSGRVLILAGRRKS